MKKFIKNLLLLFYKFISFIIRLILFIIIFISSYALYDSYQIYDSVKIEEYLEEIIEKDDSFEKLVSINKDIVGFIKIDDTTINYPILKGRDNIEYLSKNYKGDYSFSGSIFLDYRNNNFNDKYSIIYGHNLYRGGMFSDIKKYKNIDFFNKHMHGKLYTKDLVYDIRVVSYGVFNNNDEFVYNMNSYNINYIFKKSIIKSYLSNNKYILLSTCKSSSSRERMVLLCELKNSS